MKKKKILRELKEINATLNRIVNRRGRIATNDWWCCLNNNLTIDLTKTFGRNVNHE